MKLVVTRALFILGICFLRMLEYRQFKLTFSYSAKICNENQRYLSECRERQ